MEQGSEPMISEYGATIKCRECRVFIGQGHIDELPIRADRGEGQLCLACFRAELRRQARDRPGREEPG